MHLYDLKLFRYFASLRFPNAEPDHAEFSTVAGLSTDEAAFFRENGYLVTRNVIENQVCERMVNLIWDKFPSSFQRDRPETWQGKVKDCLCERTLKQRKGRLKFRECIRPEKWIAEAVCRNSAIESMARAILGAGRNPCIPYIRGIYPVFPGAFGRHKKPRPHTDGHPFLLGVMIYLEEVQAGGGGFHVWPGSHLAMRKGYRFSAGPGWSADYHKRLYGYALDVPAKEITGPAGTVIFWHHRLAHSAGFNRSQRIRHALLFDFRTSDLEDLMAKPVQDNPWEGWAFTEDSGNGAR